MKIKSMLALGASLTALSNPASALNIALTNDDGWSANGIQAMFTALQNAGHTVTLAAPLDEQSGSSAAGNRDVLIVKEADNQFSVATPSGTEGAEPGTSGLMAIDISTQLNGVAPDLLISGINEGANVGSATQLSGTVGAAIVAINKTLGGGSLPGIAISTDERCDAAGPECDEVAEFVVDYLNQLQYRPAFNDGLSGLLPEGIGLNINYPAGEPLGIKLASQGQLPFLEAFGGAVSINFGCQADCTALGVGDSAPGGIVGVTPLDEEDVPRSDADLFAEGYITIVPIKPDYTARARELKRFLQLFNRQH